MFKRRATHSSKRYYIGLRKIGLGIQNVCFSRLAQRWCPCDKAGVTLYSQHSQGTISSLSCPITLKPCSTERGTSSPSLLKIIPLFVRVKKERCGSYISWFLFLNICYAHEESHKKFFLIFCVSSFVVILLLQGIITQKNKMQNIIKSKFFIARYNLQIQPVVRTGDVFYANCKPFFTH